MTESKAYLDGIDEQCNVNAIQIENRDALLRRATAMVKQFDQYPLMPGGDLSVSFIKKVFNYNPLFVLKDLKKAVINMLLQETGYKYDEAQLLPLVEESYGILEKSHKIRILNILQKNYSEDLNRFNFRQHSYMSLRPMETRIFFYAYSVYYIAKDLKNGDSLLVARCILKGVDQIYCEKSTTPFDGIGSTGKMLFLSEFAEDKSIYDKMMNMIESAIMLYGNEECKQKLRTEKERERSVTTKEGCYIATCVYGSYDCPEVWTLRRFRDEILRTNIFGRAFVKAYYAISPWMVRWFGRKNWFKMIFIKPLNWLVDRLKDKGIEDTAYID